MATNRCVISKECFTNWRVGFFLFRVIFKTLHAFYLARKSHSGYSDWTSAIWKKKKAVLRDGSILQTAVQRKILTDVKMKAEKSVKDKDIIFSLFYPIFIQMSPLF